MFSKTIAALKVVEEEALAELNALWVPFDPATGTGNVHWHAAGASVLDNLLTQIGIHRADLEKRQAPIDAAAAEAAPVAAETLPPAAPEPPTEPAPEPEAPPPPEPEVPADVPVNPQITEVTTSA